MKKSGFSLVELSIVLVILGLLVGGILAGQSLIRAAELRSVNTAVSRYQTAAHAFIDKYLARPGDMSNATAYWTSLGGDGTNTVCQALSATGQATCNGNGDGFIHTSVTNGDEAVRFWQHLANAGLIDGQYTGTGLTSGATMGTAGGNLPASKISNAVFVLNPSLSNSPSSTLSVLSTSFAGTNRFFAGNYGNMLAFLNPVRSVPTPNWNADAMPLLPQEAWNIDTKMDDGLPGTGIVLAYKGSGSSVCTSAANTTPPGDAGATYSVSVTTKDCGLWFARVF